MIQVKLFLILAISIALSFTALNAQEQKVVSQEGNMLKVVIYGQNNNILQEGTIKNNKLHGDWASYDKSGNQLATGRYNKGKKVDIGSICSGGAYAKLISRFKGVDVPGTGISFGVDRLLFALTQLDQIKADNQKPLER